MRATILTLGCYRSTGGPSKSVSAFQRALGAKVIAWVDPRERAREPLIIPTDVVVSGCSQPGLRSVLFPVSAHLAAAEALVQESDFVSCHLFWRWHCPWLRRATRSRNTPYWLVPHGGLDPYVFALNGGLKRLFAATVAQPFLSDVRALVCSTRREFEKARRHAPRADPFILPWPLEPSDFRDRDEDVRWAVRQRLGIPEEAFCLLFLGRLHPMKRPLETITAIAQCGNLETHLIVVGNEFGITAADCRSHAERHGVANRVHVVGAAYGDCRNGYFDAADAFISLSHRENFNFSAAEAMASGLPLMLSPGNDLAADLSSVDCGWMLQDLDDAGKVIATAATEPHARLLARGRRGRAWAEDNLQFADFKVKLRGFAARLLESAHRDAS